MVADTDELSVKHIAVLDWGIGGISVLRALQTRLPRSEFTYFSDAGFTPYGRLTTTALRARLEFVVRRLRQDGADGVVFACNAASTSLSREHAFALPVIGMIEPAIELVRQSRATQVGIVGGRRTILSRVYLRGLARDGVRVKQRVAQPLSAAIERGDFRNAKFEALVQHIVRPLKECDAVLLACTHYPAAIDIFARCLPHVRLLDPAERVATAVTRAWSVQPTKARLHLRTSGDARAMHRAIQCAWGST